MTNSLLLGAGASVESGIPDAIGMTRRLLTLLRANPDLTKEAHALSFVVGGLLFDAGKRDQNPLDPAINVEDLFNAVQLLANRTRLEAAPFIGAWHSFVDELDQLEQVRPRADLMRKIYDGVAGKIVSALKADLPFYEENNIDRIVASSIGKAIEQASKGRSLGSPTTSGIGKSVSDYVRKLVGKWSSKLESPGFFSSSNVEELIDRQIRASQKKSSEGWVYQSTNQAMVRALKDVVWIDNASRTEHLKPIIDLFQSQNRLVVATLNYDNSVESICAAHGVNVNTGIEEWSESGRLNLDPGRLHLLKLHGSIDWVHDAPHRSSQSLPMDRIKKLNASEMKISDADPAVIFGSRNKLTADGPFLEFLHAFKNELESTTVLTVVGYSFRDSHINSLLASWINGEPTRRLQIVSPSFGIETMPPSEANEFLERLTSMSKSSPNRVRAVCEKAGVGLKQLFGQQ